ncbi:hypothetical protein TNCV_4755671 [Trichonephila clavipes]|nr:hypothetical protein TNCV_4755671 [Trichonephila clavipes]
MSAQTRYVSRSEKWITDGISHLAGDPITLNILKTHSEAYTTAAELEITGVCSQGMLLSDAEARCGVLHGSRYTKQHVYVHSEWSIEKWLSIPSEIFTTNHLLYTTDPDQLHPITSKYVRLVRH